LVSPTRIGLPSLSKHRRLGADRVLHRPDGLCQVFLIGNLYAEPVNPGTMMDVVSAALIAPLPARRAIVECSGDELPYPPMVPTNPGRNLRPVNEPHTHSTDDLPNLPVSQI
jgi:hypothetical protein